MTLIPNIRILTDSRHDWPSNGAALALLQYSHQSMSDTDLYFRLSGAGVFAVMKKFIGMCRNNETKRHMYEALHILKAGESKVNSIQVILDNNYYPECA